MKAARIGMYLLFAM